MNPPLVSILIPAYNAEKWIADTIRSALAQTWNPKEIIVVDDGSSDNTFEVASEFESPSVRVVGQTNQGAAAARNAALSLSKGDYIQWLDADDLLSANKVAAQIEVARARGTKLTLVYSPWAHFMYRQNKAKPIPTALWCDLSPAEFLLRKLGQKIHMQTSTWLVTRELSEAAGPWNTKMISDDDGEYFCRVLLASDGIKFVPDACVYYRSVGNTRLSYIGQSNKKLESLWGSMKLHIGYLRSLEDSDKARIACITYLQNYLINFYPQRPDIVKEMHETAIDLGGELCVPALSWKYSWIRSLFGWGLAKRARLLLPSLKASVIVSFDKMLFEIEKRRFAGIHGRKLSQNLKQPRHSGTRI